MYPSCKRCTFSLYTHSAISHTHINALTALNSNNDASFQSMTLASSRYAPLSSAPGARLEASATTKGTQRVATKAQTYANAIMAARETARGRVRASEGTRPMRPNDVDGRGDKLCVFGHLDYIHNNL